MLIARGFQPETCALDPMGGERLRLLTPISRAVCWKKNARTHV
jgi:hypothetical protein